MAARVSILSAGMVTAVGLDRLSSCAALRAKIDGFHETRFVGAGGAWQVGAPVPLPRNWIGEKRLAHLAAGAVVDALKGLKGGPGRLAVVLCLAERDRPGRPVRDPDGFAAQVLTYAGLAASTRRFVIEFGRPSGFVALDRAQQIMREGQADHVVILGVDSYLTTVSVAHYIAAQRLLSADNPNGFLPGEAAAAIVVAPGELRHFALAGLGIAREASYIYNGLDEDGLDLPLRADGMTEAYRVALDGAGVSLAQVEYRIADLTGETYFFKQSALAQQRLIRQRKEFQDLWSPAESLGNCGAAVTPLMIGWALTAYERGYAPGHPVLVEASGDDGACGAAVFEVPRGRAG
ncbi:beta-ketoacyl synthase N-terminal-like domain-containing protein [Litorisediminicola beolgyonensis]|uniref:Beta-ketoacyl synthase N-terminal-like domain-containing protein n=1 Tax=Litorisediminicola beolgyonensis TaxID=1173614 RepID=A0ABW3ZKV6_9RHOB